MSVPPPAPRARRAREHSERTETRCALAGDALALLPCARQCRPLRTANAGNMALRLRLPAASFAAALRAPCACPGLGGGALASRTPVVAALCRGFATKRATHVRFSDKKRTIPVVLLRDCNLGRLGDEVEVSPGYMRNYLYERRLAVYSTPANRRKHIVPRTTQDQAEFLRPARIAAALSSTPLVRAGGAAHCRLLLLHALTAHSPRTGRDLR